MRRIAILLPALFILGCAHTQEIPVNAPPSVFEMMTERLSGKSVGLTLAGGDSIKARLLQIGPDSTIWQAKGTGDTAVVATRDIEEIVLHNRARGAATGFFGGMLGGAVVGALVGYFGSEDPGEGCIYCFTREGSAILGGFLLGGLGGIVGMLAGSANGTRYIYRFEPVTDKRRVVPDKSAVPNKR